MCIRASLLGADGQAVSAGGEEMGLIGHFRFLKGGHQFQAVFRRHTIVCDSVPQKSGACPFIYVPVQGKIGVARRSLPAAADIFKGFHMSIFVRGDYRISQDHGVGPVF